MKKSSFFNGIREESILDSTDRSEGKLQVVKGSQVNAEKVNTKAKKQSARSAGLLLACFSLFSLT